MDNGSFFYASEKLCLFIFFIVQMADFALFQPIVPHRGTTVPDSRTGAVD